MLSCDHEWSTIDVLCKTDTGAMSYMDVEKMLEIYCHGFNNASTLSLQHPWRIVRWTYYPMLRKRSHNVINLTLLCRHCEDISNLTSWFDCCSNIINTTFIAYCELNLLSNFDATLELVVLTLWYKRHCIVVYWLYDVTILPRRCHNVACLLGYSEPNQTSKMEFLAKIVYGF